MIKGYGSHSYYLMGVCQKLYEKQAFKYTCNYQSFKFFNTSVRYSQTRFTEAISRRSLLSVDVQNIRSKRGAVKVFHSLIKKYRIPDRHEWQLPPGLCRTCFYKLLPSCHEEEKPYGTPMPDKPPQSHIRRPEILSDTGSYGKEPLLAVPTELRILVCTNNSSPYSFRIPGLQEVSTRSSMVPLIFLTPNGMFIR